MKKLVCVILILAFIFLCGCGKLSDNETEDALLSEYLDRVESFEGVIHQYGEEESRVLFGERLAVTVLYPKTGVKELDAAIGEYIDDAITTAQIDSASEELTGTAELLISYNSYLNKNGIVSVELAEHYTSSVLAHPVDLIKTFSCDMKSGKLIAIDDILREGKRAEIENRLIKDFDIDRDFSDEDLLSQWVLTDNCLKIVLTRGEFLPMSDGTKSYTFTKKETKTLLKDGKEEESIQVNQEEEAESIPAKNPETHIDTDKAMIALTFDDGPSAYTQRLLDIFRRHGGKGTFFVLGNTLDNRRDTLKRMVAEGHEIGNHSWSHRQFTNIDIDEVKDQIMMTRAKIYDITGIDCTIVRPPYGACNDEIRALGEEIGVSFVNWSVDTLDWKTKNADAVYKEIMKDVGDGHIILCHDLHKTTVDAMEKVIPDLIKQGYQLVTVSELLTCRGGAVQAGKMYYKQVKGQ
ncbi:MAG: polysaccharide deacetylase family protein [Clostridia bacterium]|nr:polysaccharide deacetylase family protein [Clostridia bacterium]